MYNTIGYKIKALRKEKKLSQQSFNCSILNRTVLSKIENVKIIPSIPQLEHISNILEVPINYFFSDELQVQEITQNTLPSLVTLYNEKKYFEVLDIFKSKGSVDINTIYYVGMCYYNINLYKDALKYLRKYVNDYRKLPENDKRNYINEYAIVLNALSCIMLNNSNCDKALHYLYMGKESLAYAGLTTSKIYHVIINNIGSIYCLMEQYRESINILEPFIEDVDDLAYISQLGNIHLTLNIDYYRLNKFTEAIKHIKLAIIFFEYNNRDFDAGECYLNYINCLRLSSRSSEALHIIEELKQKYSSDKKLINLFLIQQMIILFNLKDFDNLSLVIKQLNVKELRKKSKMDYYLVLGHIKYLEKNYSTAYNYLKKCESFLLSRKLYLDLSFLYRDLSIITNEIEYTNKSRYYLRLHTENPKYNIFGKELF